MFVGYFFRRYRKYFSKLDFHKIKFIFKRCCFRFSKENGFEPELVNSEKEEKNSILIRILQNIQFIFQDRYFW